MTNENKRLKEKYYNGGYAVLLSKPEANGVYHIMSGEPDWEDRYKYALISTDSDQELIMTKLENIEIFSKDIGKPILYSDGKLVIKRGTTSVEMSFTPRVIDIKTVYTTTTPDQWFFTDEWLDELVYYDTVCYYKLTKEKGIYKTNIIVIAEDRILSQEEQTSAEELNHMLSTYGAKPIPKMTLNLLKEELDKSPIDSEDPLSAIVYNGNTFTISFTVNNSTEAIREVRKLFTGTKPLAGLECNRVDLGDSREIYATKIAHFTKMCNSLIDAGEVATDGLADYVLPHMI